MLLMPYCLIISHAISSKMIISGLFLLGVVYGCSGDRTYKIKIEKFQANVLAEGLVGNASVQLIAYNETMTCISGFLELIGPIPPGALIAVAGFERSREDKNAYQRKPTVNYTVNICDFLKNDDNVMPELMLRSNIDQTCPPQPKNYTIDCFNLEPESLPDTIPGEDHWMFTLHLYQKNSTLSPVMAYAVAYVYFDSSDFKQRRG